MRRTTALLAAVLLVLTAVLHSTLTAGASRANDISAQALALPQSALPAGAIIDHNAVSDNPDADGSTTPPDGHAAQIHVVHTQFYEVLGRVTGYRMDFHWMLSGQPVGTEYVASIFGSEAQAKAAMDDVTAPGHLISIIGAPLTHQCTVGTACAAYSGPNPGSNPPTKAVFALFYDGPILVETASQVPLDQFDALEPQLETSLYSFLVAADAQVQIALGKGPAGSPTATTAATAASTAVPTATSTPVRHKKHVSCKKGTKLVHGKCKKVKKKKP